MNEKDLMFKGAFYYLKPFWKLKDGDIIYIEYSEEDKQFSKEHWPHKEDHNGFWCVESHLKFQTSCGEGDRYSEYIKGKAAIWRAREEDLQNIYLEESEGVHVSTMEQSFHNWYWQVYGPREGFLEQHDWNILWLCFIMEVCFGRWWNGKEWAQLRGIP